MMGCGPIVFVKYFPMRESGWAGVLLEVCHSIFGCV